MQHTGREHTILAAHPSMKQTDEKIRIFSAPAAIGGIEAVDAVKIGSPNAQIARARAAPGAPPESAQRTERQAQDGKQAIDASAQALVEPGPERPMFGLELLA